MRLLVKLSRRRARMARRVSSFSANIDANVAKADQNWLKIRSRNIQIQKLTALKAPGLSVRKAGHSSLPPVQAEPDIGVSVFVATITLSGSAVYFLAKDFRANPGLRACLKSRMRGHVIIGVMTISTDVDKLYDTDLTDEPGR